MTQDCCYAPLAAPERRLHDTVVGLVVAVVFVIPATLAVFTLL